MSMTNKQLKEMLNQYPDESFIFIHNNEDEEHIVSINVKYFDENEYAIPDIALY